jgi:hypothetical protein
MEETKSLLASKTVWGGIIVVLSVVASMVGYTISAEDQVALTSFVGEAITLVGGLLAIWGRVTATKKIG